MNVIRMAQRWLISSIGPVARILFFILEGKRRASSKNSKDIKGNQ